MSAHSFDTPLYILDAVRTAMGSPYRSLKEKTAVQLGAAVIQGLHKHHPKIFPYVDEVAMGQTVQAGNGQNPGRLAALLGGVSETTPSYTVNHVCASGLEAVIQVGRAIALGHVQLAIAGGMESATHAPHLFTKIDDTPFDQRQPIDSLILDGLWCSYSGQHMGQLCEALARKEKISRNAQDQFTFQSHQKAQAAQDAGHFENEIVAVRLDSGNLYEKDERLRHLSLENLKSLPPAFQEKGTITSGSASTPCDGAAAMLLASQRFVKTHRLKPFARILGYASIAVRPQQVFTAAVPAVKACLQACGLKFEQIDLVEVAEAFAAQAIYTQKQLKIPAKKFNVWGGDIALGHPLGAAGTRILVTLTYALKQTQGRYGLAVICMGGGGAIAVIVER